MNSFNRLHFFKRFDASKDFVVIKNFVWSGHEYKVGDDFDKSSTYKQKLERLWNTRKIACKEVLLNPTELVNAVVEINLVPEIKKGPFGWLTVMVGDKQIGAKTRDMEEAKRIVDEWLESPE